ncbi:hypothetical protein ACH4U3_04115 [Streptomyces griseoruber]|uniref:hypothetical protein n=1 Tax=Streptomyces griseoruber TaxID=1943 RepID=UPI0037A074FC
MGLIAAGVVAAAFWAAWDQYSHEVFAWTCVCAVIGAAAAVKASELSRKEAVTPPEPGSTSHAWAFWIAWKVGGVALLLLVMAAWSEWF